MQKVLKMIEKEKRKKTRFEKDNSRKLAAVALPIFIIVFVIVNMELLYFVINMINIGITDEMIDNLPYMFQLEFWVIGLIISLFIFLQVFSGVAILVAWNTLDTDLFKRALSDHKDFHRLLEEKEENEIL